MFIKAYVNDEECTDCLKHDTVSRLSLFLDLYKSKKDDKDQKSIQSSTTPVPGYHMGK